MRRFPLALLLAVATLLLSLYVVPIPDAPARSRLRGGFEAVVADTDVNLYGVKAFKNGTIYLCGTDGYFVRSTDGGKTWNAEQVKEGVSLRTMTWLDEKTGVIAGRTRTGNYVLRTTDGGITFEDRRLDVPFRVRGFAFTDSSSGWLVAGSLEIRDGAWLKTQDGGRSWKKLESVAYGLPARLLHSISSGPEKHLWAVGTHVEAALVGEAAKSLLYRHKRGSVLSSVDGGRTWDVRDAGNPLGTSLRDVSFVDTMVGYVVGDGGFMARTADGGKTWKKLATGTTVRLLAVDAVSVESAFAVGERGTAIATGDSGESFSTLATGTKVHLRDCSFTSKSAGYAVGRDGTVLRFKRRW